MRLSLRSSFLGWLVFASLGMGTGYGAETGKDPYVELLEDPFPSASAPFALDLGEYVWRGVDQLPAGSRIDWIGDDVQWTRASERLVLPRARVRVAVAGGEGALAVVNGRVHPLRNESGDWVGEVGVPVIAAGDRGIEIRLRRGAQASTIFLALDRRPRAGSPERIGLDPSCSPAQLEIRPEAPAPGAPLSVRPTTLFAHCRLIRHASSAGLSGALDVLFWLDGGGDRIRVDGHPVAAERPSIFRLQLDSAASPVRIETAGGERFTVGAKVPARVNRGFFGLGLGPYRYRLLAPETDVSTAAGVMTVYGSYQLTDSVRLTAFNATTLHRNFFTDTGFYVKSDSARFFDQRVTVYLMLGANVVGFHYGGRTRMKGGAPQGFEAVYHDFGRKNRALTVGAFIYPPIDGKSYYNTWVRYGAGGFFGELNYLSIRDRFDDRAISSRSAGVSVGFPFARFF